MAFLSFGESRFGSLDGCLQPGRFVFSGHEFRGELYSVLFCTGFARPCIGGDGFAVFRHLDVHLRQFLLQGLDLCVGGIELLLNLLVFLAGGEAENGQH